MPKKLDKSSVSFGSWFLTIFMAAIPCLGVLYIAFGALFSTNESRRNFYRAHLAWWGIIIVLYGAFFMVGFAPDIRKLYDQYKHGQPLSLSRSSEPDSHPAEKKKTKKPEDSE